MKKFVVKNILSFLDLDEHIITEITSNQLKILNHLEHIQDSQNNNINLLDKNMNQDSDSNFKNIIFYTIGIIFIIGIIYYFMSGGGSNNGEIFTNYSNISQEILQKINTSNANIDGNLKYMLNTILKNNNNLIDVVNKLFIQNDTQINKVIFLRLFNAILQNGRHLEDITKILEGFATNIKTDTTATDNIKKVVFSDES